MTAKEFVKSIAHEKKDLLADFIGLLRKEKIPFCIIGGLAVNAYAEPVVSLDIDVVVVAGSYKKLLGNLKDEYKVKKFPKFPNSFNITSPDSDMRIQIQTDKRYQPFISRARVKRVLGYKLPVASIEDVLSGKIRAVLDATRRPSKRQKDLADILRLIEAKRELISLVPASLKKRLSFQEFSPLQKGD
ncbi:MAG: nucleotidyl transferase AbiEii/AbiGii toxin family protein [Elusimicrobiota bacterium]